MNRYVKCVISGCFFMFFISRSLDAMRSGGAFWEDDEVVDKDKWSIYDLKGKKRKSKARSALLDAVVNGQLEIVKLLLEKGADINAREQTGWTALHWAIHYNRSDIARYLVEKGADINAITTDGYGWTPLALAIRDKNIEITKLLINSGAEVKQETNAAKSSLSQAIRKGQPDMAELMIKNNIFIAGSPRAKEYPLAIAHRGDSAHFPENTLPALEGAVKSGANMVTVGVYMTKDNELVVLRDSDLDKRTSGEGRVWDHDLDEIQKLDAGSWFDESFKSTIVPSLEQVFKVIGNKVLINVELKTDYPCDPEQKLERELAHLIKEYKLTTSVIITSFDYRKLVNMRRLSKEVNLAVLSRNDDKNLDIVKLVEAVGAFSYNPEWKYVTSELVEKLHEGGVMIMPWTEKKDCNEETMQKLLDMNVDGIYVDDPSVLKSILKKRADAKIVKRKPTEK